MEGRDTEVPPLPHPVGKDNSCAVSQGPQQGWAPKAVATAAILENNVPFLGFLPFPASLPRSQAPWDRILSKLASGSDSGAAQPRTAWVQAEGRVCLESEQLGQL